MLKSCDIAIVGGGIVGNLIAHGILRRTTFSVRMFATEMISSEPSKTGLDARVIALAKRSVNELKALGCNFCKLTATPIRTIQVTDKGHTGFSELTADEFGLDEFGQVVSIHQLGRALHDALVGERFSLVAPTKVTHLQQQVDHVQLTTIDNEIYTAKLVIIADGGGNEYAQNIGWQYQQKDYQQHAIITNIETALAHNNVAYERFTTSGPVALLPYQTAHNGDTSANSFSVVWTCSPAQAESLLQATQPQFMQQLQQVIGWRQGKIKAMSTPLHYPLSLRWLSSPIAHRCVAVGNAAQTLHPIAGQGFNLGLRDAMTLLRCLKDSTARSDPGQLQILYQYKQSRFKDRQQTIGLTDTLVHLFANDYFSTTIGRNIGLTALDNCRTVKRAFVRATTGLSHNLNGSEY